MRIRPPLGLINAAVDRLYGSLRFHTFGAENIRRGARMSRSRSAIFCLWHQSLAAIIGPHGGFRCAALASRSGDGAIIAGVLEHLGYRTVRGSSARGGIQAAKELSAAIDAGWLVAITVDGPRGPARRPKPGAIELARRHQVAVVPIAARASRELTFRRSWDRFRLPLPGAHVALVYGDPILYPPHEPSPDELSARQRALAAALDELEAEATRRIRSHRG